MRRIIAERGIVVALAVAFAPSTAPGQEQLTQQCATLAADQTRRFCNLVVEAIEIAQPRIGIALTGGNPIPGANSTLGMRLGAAPRVSAGVRITGVSIELPPIQSPASTEVIDAFVPALNIDASLGLLGGWSLSPTVGGFGSLDLVASAGIIPLPGADGFGDAPTSWGAGARVGILRESFTAPGVSVTAMYRRISDVMYGDATLQTEQSYFSASSASVISIRGVVGKRFLTLGTTAGLGWDRYTSDVTLTVSSPGTRFTEDGFKDSRLTAFGGLQFTFLVLSLVGELGWQSGGDDFSAPLPTGQRSTVQNSSWYGTLALRLAI